jgi:hypothetical protein
MNEQELIETNELECVILKKDGEIERIANGKLERADSLPSVGASYPLGIRSCTVRGHAYTPDLKSTWHLFLQEN